MVDPTRIGPSDVVSQLKPATELRTEDYLPAAPLTAPGR